MLSDYVQSSQTIGIFWVFTSVTSIMLINVFHLGYNRLLSAPYLFNMVSDALEWILRHHFGVQNCFHYLDDFFITGSLMAITCAGASRDILLPCQAIPLVHMPHRTCSFHAKPYKPSKPEKVLGPSTNLPFVGIVLQPSLNQKSSPSPKPRSGNLTHIKQVSTPTSHFTPSMTSNTCLHHSLLCDTFVQYEVVQFHQSI